MAPSLLTAREREAIFRRWIDHHLGLILKIVRGSPAAPHDQDDLFQEILLQLWFSVPSFRGEAKETTWIYRVAFNTMLSWNRGERRRRQGEEAWLETINLSASQPSHLETSRDEQIVARLYQFIHQLPKLDASLAFMLLDGLTYQEMAEVLGISENHIGVKLTRIRQRLADQWKEHGDGL
jgi:RNA polymerase sigma-70 factor (ECF subfamily)